MAVSYTTLYTLYHTIHTLHTQSRSVGVRKSQYSVFHVVWNAVDPLFCCFNMED